MWVISRVYWQKLNDSCYEKLAWIWGTAKKLNGKEYDHQKYQHLAKSGHPHPILYPES